MRKFAVFLDFDDTLVHTEKIKFRSLEAYLLTFGIKEFQRKAGQSSSKIIKDIFSYKTEKVRELLANDFKVFQADFMKKELEKSSENILFPHTVELLTFLKNKNIQFNIVTTSNKLVLKNVVTLTGLDKFIETKTAITKDETPGKEKPNPYPYKLAAKRLGISPNDCFAVEDSLTGLKAASDSGCKTIFIKRNNTVSPKDDIKIFRTISNLKELIDIINVDL